MRGRKPKPTKLKELRGNPGKRRVNTDEPSFETAIPIAPDHLTDDALIEWNRITHELASKNVIATVDLAILAVYCSTFAQLCNEENTLKDEVSISETDKGYKYVNPRVGLVNTLRQHVAKYAAELGITPSSRSRVKATTAPPAPKSKQDALAQTLFIGAKIAK